MNLLVLATGGTIGSAPKGTGLDTDAAQTPLLLQMYRRQYGEHARFTVRQLCAVLSENIEDSFYETLCTALCAPETARFDGVIVLHGTDTLPYTAALCAMACRQLCVPVCFVSSAYVLTDPRQNGLLNLRAAVRYIEAGGAGFAVPFHNTGDTTEIHLATRLLEADPFTDCFSSAADAPLAVLCGDEIRFPASPQLPTQEELRTPLRARSEAPLCLQKKIALLACFPGMAPKADALSADYAAALLWGYHSGTAPQKALADFAAQMRAQNRAVYLAPVKRAAEQYASTNALLACGVRPMYALTAPAALARLKIAYNQSNVPPEALAEEVLYYEEVPASV